METYANAISIIPAGSTTLFSHLPAESLAGYVLLTDEASWILTTEASADALDLGALPGADLTDFSEVDYADFWAEIAQRVEILGDVSDPEGAVCQLCAREGIEIDD